jgi:hypothetical protein
VSAEQSRREIESTLTRFGATGFIYGWQGRTAIIGFRMTQRHVKFLLPLPEGTKDADQREARRRWRALLLVIKAKLAAVTDGITEFDDEFMAHIVMPDGSTLGERLKPQIEDAYKTGKMPPLLPFYKN